MSKWVLFAMIMSASSEPIDIRLPGLTTPHPFDTPTECSRYLVKAQKVALELGGERYLICDYVPEKDIEAAHELHREQFRSVMSPF